jgi:PAS domain S-box-containing protein
VALTGEPIVESDITKDSRVTTSLISEAGIHSFAAIALKSKGKVLGVVCIGTHRHHDFGDEEIQLYTSIANHVGIAIENARLYEERVMATEALKKSEALHKEAQSIAHIGHWELDPGIGTPVWSEEIFRMFGLDPDEGEPSFTDHETHVHPEDWPILNKAVRKAGGDGTPFDLVFRIVRPDGEMGWMHVIGTTSMDEEGNVTKLFGTAQDITTLRQTELKLEDSEELHRTTIENISDAIFITDDRGAFKYICPNTPPIFGLTAEEVALLDNIAYLLGGNIFEPDELYGNGELTNIECTIEDSHGREHFLLVNVKRVSIQTGTVLYTCRDITERKQAEDTLIKREKELRLIADNVPALVSYIDGAGYYRFVNKKYEEWFAIPQKEIVGQYYGAVLGDETYKLIKERVKATLSGQRVRYEEALPYKHGGKRYVIADYVPDTDEYGKVKGFFALVTDITDRKNAEEALQESEEKYRSLVESTEDSIYLIDKGCNYLFINRNHLQRFALDPDSVVGRSYEEFHTQGETNEFRGRVDEVIKTGSSHRYVYESKRDGGHYLRTLSPVKDLEGKTTAVTVVSKDVTEMIKTEKDLRQTNEKLSRAHKQRKILSKRLIDILEKDRRQIAMELHDHIGQTLASLKMDIEMIHSQLKSEDPELGARIKAVQERTVQAIKDVKDISRGLRPGILDALGLVPSLRELFSEIKRQTDIEIKFFSRGIPERFAPDKEVAIYRIAQEALTNIIRNANAKNVFVNLVRKDENLSLSVEDDGVGFDPDEVMGASKGQSPFGLLIMRERAEQLDGEFTLESRIGKGTHVLVEIPL